ncbi:MAG: hypothetical protein AAF902_22580 [Chloroflexota bacterium]
MNLENLLEQVKDELTLLRFLKALKVNRENLENEWESHSIEDFLERSIAWAEDSELGESQTDNPFKKTALLFYAGKKYE